MKKRRRPTRAELNQMTHTEKDALIMRLFDLLEGVERRLAKVERKVEKTSRNSNRPPSSDGLKRQAAEALRPAYEGIRQKLIAADVAHFDESGVRVTGGTQWLYVAGTTDLAFYTIHSKRGPEAMTAAGILPKFTRHMMHDHWAPYFHFAQATHCLCSAHLLRELRYFEEATGGHRWPVRLREILVDGKKAVEAARAEGQSAVDAATRDRLLADYDRWVTLGLSVFPERPKTPGQKGRPKQEPATNLLRRLLDFRTEIWRFLHDFRVPFDNNPAERLVRSVKVKLKVAGGFRAVGGAASFCILRSIWQPNKLQGTNPFHTLRIACAGGLSSYLGFRNTLVAETPAGKELHVILDNYCTYKKCDAWLARHPNVHFHFTPTSASWLNQGEIWFGILSRKALRGASFQNIAALRQAIEDFVAAYNPTATPFRWRKR